MTYLNHPVSTIILAESGAQPAGATGDARRVSVIFSDSTLPMYATIAMIKALPDQFTAQASEFTNTANQFTTRAATATANATDAQAMVTIVSAF